MDSEKMTTTMQEALAEAQSVAMNRHHQDIDIVHLWKIFMTPDNFARGFYQSIGVDVDKFEKVIDQELDRLPVVEGSSVNYGQNISQNLYSLLSEADKLRESFQDDYLATEIVILALMKLKNYVLTKYLLVNGLT
ncbi:MAG: Clp protease N-terminal domain-containing protein, partial [Carnobacterium sp.]